MGSLPETADRTQDDVSSYAMQLATGSALPMTLKAAIELNLLDIIARAGPNAQLSPQEIVDQLPTNNPEAAVTVDRILCFLASHSILKCYFYKAQRRYGLSPVSSLFVSNEEGFSLAPLLVMNQDKVFMESWFYLKESVLNGGIPFNKAHGLSAFDYPETDPRFNKVFNDGMFNHSTITVKKMLEVYKGFDGIDILVDVGGGVAASLNMIISAYPSMKGVNFDLPHVIAEAPFYRGIEHLGGDMFEKVPSGDAIFMKWILHDWSDEHCLKLLKNCWKALPEKGKVIVMEGVLPEIPETTNEAQALFHMDMLMFAYNPGGKERTEKEFKLLAKGAGFSRFEKVCPAFGFWVMEFTK